MAAKRSKNQLRREKAKIRKLENGSSSKSEKDGLNSPGLDEVKETPEIKEKTTDTDKVRESTIDKEENGSTEISKDSDSKDISGINKESETANPEETNNTKESIEYNSSNPVDDYLFQQFSSIFTKFQGIEEEKNDIEDNQLDLKGDVYYSSDESDASDTDSKPVSSRQLRKSTKVPLALLKSATKFPQLVDWYDVDAKDPYLLVALKSQPNVVQVPEHWTAKREFLSQRKGIDRPPFQLPKYIQDTGIQDMRGTDDRNLRQQQRDKVQPKMGRLDIDYQRLHDAFFKYQSKPRLFGYGDLYFEGREGEDFKDEVLGLKPGVISSALRKALDLPDNNRVAPPWIALMVKLGKSPSYKQLLIPGVDMEYDNKGYRDSGLNANVVREHWGKLTEESESEEEEEESEEEEEVQNDELQEDEEEVSDDEQPVKVAITEVGRNGRQVTKSAPIKSDDGPKSLYTVLEEKQMAGDGILDSKGGYKLGNEKEEVIAEEIEKVEEKEKKFKF